MTITALLFASYADALGRPSVELSLEPGATVRDALFTLRGLPGGTALPPAPLVAVMEKRWLLKLTEYGPPLLPSTVTV